jgi:hypothetical protein
MKNLTEKIQIFNEADRNCKNVIDGFLWFLWK